MSISKDKYIAFFIDNYSDIEALHEISDHAKSNIPSLLDREMKNYIREIDFDNVEVRFDDGTVWWCDPELYDLEQEKGPYFGYESKWDSLFSGNDPEDASYLYLYIDIGNLKQKTKKKEYIDQWVTVLKKESNKLKKLKINFVASVDYDDPYILKYPLHREVNMVNIADRAKFKKVVQETIKIFTSTCLSILRRSN